MGLFVMLGCLHIITPEWCCGLNYCHAMQTDVRNPTPHATWGVEDYHDLTFFLVLTF